MYIARAFSVLNANLEPATIIWPWLSHTKQIFWKKYVEKS